MNEAITPFYTNWTFWAVIISLVALVLSQLPPIKLWFKKPKLEIELYSKFAISHKIGNPTLQLHLVINNIGGSKIRIKDISATIKRDNELLCTLPVQNYLQNQNDINPLIFVPCSLNSSEEWVHIINLFKFFTREDENQYRNLEAKMFSNFREKKKTVDPSSKDLIEIDEDLVKPFYDFFERHFIWKSGDYLLTFSINTDNEKANVSRNYRFTIFESHTEQLKEMIDSYKYGDGIWWYSTQKNIILDIKEQH